MNLHHPSVTDADLKALERIPAEKRNRRLRKLANELAGGIGSVAEFRRQEAQAVEAFEAKHRPSYDAFGARVSSAYDDDPGQLVTCDKCSEEYGVGDSPWCRDGHEPVQPRGGFEPRFDIGLGEYVTGWGDVKQHMRRKHLDYREHPSQGDLSARRDRIEEGKRTR